MINELLAEVKSCKIILFPNPKYPRVRIPVYINASDEPLDKLGETDGYIIKIFLNSLVSLLKDYGVEDLSKQLLCKLMNSVIVHEYGHVIFTDFNALSDYIWNIKNLETESYLNIFKSIWNILEDVRIEFLMRIDYPSLARILTPLRIITTVMPEENLDSKLSRFILGLYMLTFKDILFTRNIDINIALDHAFGTFIDLWEIINDKRFRILKLIEEAISTRNAIAPLQIADYITKVLDKKIGFPNKTSIMLLHKIEKIPGEILNLLKILDDQPIMKISNKDSLVKENVISKKISELNKNEGGIIGASVSIDYPEERSMNISFYIDTVKRYKRVINDLKRQIKDILSEWRVKKTIVGEISEEHLQEIYAWSFSKDEPRPEIFELISREVKPLNIFLHVDQSGSVYGEKGEIIMRSVIIILESLESLVKNELLRVATATFGPYPPRILKEFTEQTHWGRFYPSPAGGTEIYRTLKWFIMHQYPYSKPEWSYLVIIFTDGINYPKDNKLHKDVRDLLNRKYKSGGKIVGIIPQQTLQLPEIKEFIKTLDHVETLFSLSELPGIIMRIVKKEIKKQYR